MRSGRAGGRMSAVQDAMTWLVVIGVSFLLLTPMLSFVSRR